MKKVLAALTMLASISANAEIKWEEAPVNLEDLKQNAISEINTSISHAGGLDRLIDDANNNDAQAIYILSRMHHLGIVKEKDLVESIRLLKLSANQNHSLASHYLSKIYLGKDSVVGFNENYLNYKEGIKYLKQAAESGIAESQHLLGLYYIEGEIVNEDRDLGLFWLAQAKNQMFEPSIKARNEIINKIEKTQFSFDYVRKRAINGNVEFLVKLAEFYDNGWVVQEDKIKSIRILKVAAELGSEKAINKLREKNIPHH